MSDGAEIVLDLVALIEAHWHEDADGTKVILETYDLERCRQLARVLAGLAGSLLKDATANGPEALAYLRSTALDGEVELP